MEAGAQHFNPAILRVLTGSHAHTQLGDSTHPSGVTQQAEWSCMPHGCCPAPSACDTEGAVMWPVGSMVWR